MFALLLAVKNKQCLALVEHNLAPLAEYSRFFLFENKIQYTEIRSIL
jgi:hypothetical protein